MNPINVNIYQIFSITVFIIKLNCFGSVTKIIHSSPVNRKPFGITVGAFDKMQKQHKPSIDPQREYNLSYKRQFRP